MHLSVQSSRETLELENALFSVVYIKGKKVAAATGTAMGAFGRNGRNGAKNPPIQHASDEKN